MSSKTSNATLFSKLSLFFSILALVGGILLLAVIMPRVIVFEKVLCVIAAILCFILFLLCGYYYLVDRKQDPNFFLLDRKTQKNVPLSSLSFGMIDDKMTFYLTLISESPYDYWRSDVLVRKFRDGKEASAARPYLIPVIYKIFYDLAISENDDEWDAFFNANRAEIDFISDILNRCGEKDLAKLLTYLDSFAYRPKIQECIQGEASHLEEVLFAYVRKHIDWYY